MDKSIILQNPINIETLYITNSEFKDYNFKYNDLYGGGTGDELIILSLLNNKTNNNAYIRYPNSNKFLHMQIPIGDLLEKTLKKDKFNPKNTNTSVYVANGLYSTAVAYRTISKFKLLKNDNIEHIPYTSEDEILIVKMTILKQKGKELFDEWRDGFNIYYSRFKILCGNLIADLYFKGSNIEVNQVNLNDTPIIKDSNRQIVFDIWKYYNGDISQYAQKLIYLVKSIGICIYAFYILERFIFDLKKDNVMPDNKQNLICIDVEYKLLPEIRKKSYGHNNYIFYNNILTNSISYVSFKKQLFCKLKLYEQETEKWLYDELAIHRDIINRPRIVLQKDNDDIALYTTITSQIFSKWVKQKISTDQQIEPEKGDPYYINYEPLYEKVHVLFIYQLLIQLFYKDFSILNLLRTDKLTSIKDTPQTVLELFHTERIIGKNNMFQVTQILTFHNLNNIAILRQYMVALKKVKFDLNVDISEQKQQLISEQLQQLIYWPEHEVGLLAPNFEDVPCYGLIFKTLGEIFGFNNFITADMKKSGYSIETENIYSILQKLIHENIGTYPLSETEVPIFSGTPLEIQQQKWDYEYVKNTPTSAGTSTADYKRILNEKFIAEFKKYTCPDTIAELKLENISFDNITYKQWAISRSTQKSKYNSVYNSQFKSEESLLYPSSYGIFSSNKLRVAPFIYIPELIKDERTNRFMINPDIQQIKADPSIIVELFRKNKDTYQLFNPYEREIPYDEYIDDSIIRSMKRQLTPQEIDDIKVILYPERSLIKITDINIDTFEDKLKEHLQTSGTTQSNIRIMHETYKEYGEVDLTKIDSYMEIFKHVFSVLQITDKLQDIIDKIKLIDFTKLYTKKEIILLINPTESYTPTDTDYRCIILLLQTILQYINLTENSIQAIIERLYARLTQIKNLAEIFNIILSQIEFTESNFNLLIQRLKFKSVKTDFLEEEIIGIIVKLRIRMIEEKNKAIDRVQIIDNATEAFNLVVKQSLEDLKEFNKLITGYGYDPIHYKYLKYREKYLKLKNELNI